VRYLEVRRHTDNDDDRLSAEGVESARRIGAEGLHPPYDAFVSTGAARATEMLEILRSAAGQEEEPIIEQPALRSVVEDRWREAARVVGTAEVEEIRRVDPDLVEKETQLLGGALRQVLGQLPDGGRALIVGHSPTNEAAVLGLAGRTTPPLGKGEGILVTEDRGTFRVEPLR
jgi:phosphohistidine phosphatase SixA